MGLHRHYHTRLVDTVKSIFELVRLEAGGAKPNVRCRMGKAKRTDKLHSRTKMAGRHAKGHIWFVRSITKV